MQFSIFAVHSVADGLFFLPQVVSNFASPIALIVAAGIVRKSRVSTHPKVWETTLPNVPSPFETARAQGSKPGSVPASDPLRTRWAIRADAFVGDRWRIQPVGDQIRCHSRRTVVQMELIGMDDEAIPRGDVVPAAAKNVMLYGGAEQ